MKRIILLIVGILIAGIAMCQVNGSFKSVRIINSDSTHGVIPGTIYRGSDLILRWVDEAGTTQRFFKSGSFWKLSGTSTFTGDVTINGGSHVLSFNNLTSLQMSMDGASFISSGAGLEVSGNGGSGLLSLTNALTFASGGVVRYVVESDGSWNINSSNGTSGQLLTSAGSSSTPTWTTPLATTLNMSTARILGRTTAGTGAVEQITVGTGLSLSGGSLTATSGVTSATSPITLGSGVISTSMATNKLLGRSTAGTGVAEEITISTGLSLSGGNLSSTVSGITGLTANRMPVAASATTLQDFSGLTYDNPTNTINLVSGGVFKSGASVYYGPEIDVTSGDLIMNITGSNGDIEMGATRNVNIHPSADVVINPNSQITLTGANVTLNPTSSININPGGDFNITANLVGDITDGTYTPTLTNTTNITASTAFAAQYMRVGNTVTVSGRVDIDPTSATTLTVLEMSLPIASNFASTFQAGGTAFSSEVAGLGAAISAEITNNRAVVSYTTATDVANRSFGFSFTYLVQ